MMISPESFIKEYENLPYSELLPVRDELIEAVKAFEEHSYGPEEELVHPSPAIRYQCNLEYLGRICGLIAEKYNQEYVWGE